MCTSGIDSPLCSSPTFSLKYKFSHCFSCCLDLAVALVTAIELDSVSRKSVSITGIPVSLALVGRYSAHATASHTHDCPD